MIEFINADARHIPLADNSVQCVITSPPYYGLRDYGTAKWEGGSVECDHRQPETRKNGSTFTGGKATTGHAEEGYKTKCAKCGAIRADAQIGLERTPQEYVDGLVAVFREVWRVLADDGVVWLNLGDSYAGMKGASGQGNSEYQAARSDVSINKPHHQLAGKKLTRALDDRAVLRSEGYKPKDLLGIPWRVAFALQADGWYLRSDIIWAKPNPMPESVTDRPTKAHEYVFLLSKSEKYFYDADAIAEPAQEWTGQAATFKRENGKATELAMPGQAHASHRADRKQDALGKRTYTGFNDRYESGPTRNRRTVWTVATSPYSGAHFATFPPKLVEPMILAGSRPGDIVLDPFAGSGTVGKVCIEHRRQFIGLELNPAYIELAQDRTSNVGVRML